MINLTQFPQLHKPVSSLANDNNIVISKDFIQICLNWISIKVDKRTEDRFDVDQEVLKWYILFIMYIIFIPSYLKWYMIYV